ncbi:Ejaculatory bulb-specific protein 3 [Eumeta japonica]|uniref:Ejaculatory bulb-specific protein 3 n=1 Tax=Eumeta variegata TaxID=151549 RepID=A0A4C1SZV6_EUMVA|nr:Ejaculatory bulb-specific protein 3 [Eumeta japonica]
MALLLHKAQSLSTPSSSNIMFKLTVLVCCALAVCLARPDDDKYPEVDSNFNVSELLENDRLLLNYIKCLLDEGPCTSQVKKIKVRESYGCPPPFLQPSMNKIFTLHHLPH